MPLASEDFLVGEGVMSACEAASFFLCFFFFKKNLPELKKTRKGGPDCYNLNATSFFFFDTFFNIIWVSFYFYEI